SPCAEADSPPRSPAGASTDGRIRWPARWECAAGFGRSVVPVFHCPADTVRPLHPTSTTRSDRRLRPGEPGQALWHTSSTRPLAASERATLGGDRRPMLVALH